VEKKRYTQRDVRFQIKCQLRLKDMVEDWLQLTGQVEQEFGMALEKAFGPHDQGKPLTLLITIKIVSNGASILNQVIKLVMGRRWSYPMLEIDYILKSKESEEGILIDGRLFKIRYITGVNDDIVMMMAMEMTSKVVDDVYDKLKWIEH